MKTGLVYVDLTTTETSLRDSLKITSVLMTEVIFWSGFPHFLKVWESESLLEAEDLV